MNSRGWRRSWLLFAAAAAAALAAAACDDARQAALQPPAPGIPSRAMTRTLKVQVARDAQKIYLRVRFPSASPGALQEYFHYDGSQWIREGGGFRDYAAALAADADRGDVTRVSAHSEDVLGVLWSARGTTKAVRDFDKYGCFTMCHERERQMPNWRASDGDSPMVLWPGFGGFADAWTWRAHRTDGAKVADDGWLGTGGLLPDAGAAPFSALSLTNGEPAYVFDAAQNGGLYATPWSQVLASGESAFDDGTLAAFPDAIPWAVAGSAGYVAASGDAVPAQRLGTPGGSRANVAADATWAAGEWDVRLTRLLVSTDGAHDVSFSDGGVYDVAFSLHSDDADGRDHYVTLPLAFALGTTTGAIPVPLLASAPDFSDETAIPVTNVESFLPGVTSFEFLVGAVTTRDGAARTWDVRHGGHTEVANSERRCVECHAIHSTDPRPSYRDAGSLESLVLRRGGVFGETPFFEAAP